MKNELSEFIRKNGNDLCVLFAVAIVCITVIVCVSIHCHCSYHNTITKACTKKYEERLRRIEAVTKTYPTTDIEEALEGKGNGNPDVKDK